MPSEKFPTNPADAPTIDDIVDADNNTYVVPSRGTPGVSYHMSPTEVRDGFVILSGKSADGDGDTRYKSMTIGDYLNNRDRLPKVVREEMGADALTLTEQDPPASQENTEDGLDGAAPQNEASVEDDPKPKVLTQEQAAELKAAWSEAFLQVDTGEGMMQKLLDSLEGRAAPLQPGELLGRLQQYQPDHTLVKFRSDILKERTENSGDKWLQELLGIVSGMNIQPQVADSLRNTRSNSEAVAQLQNAIGYIRGQRARVSALLRSGAGATN